MPRKPKKPCRYPGCPNLTDNLYCDVHTSKVNYQYNHYMRDPDSNKRYGPEWRKIRARYIALHPLCEDCLKQGIIEQAEEVHHIVPLAEGGTNDDDNLRALSKRCHSKYTRASTNKKHHESGD